MSLRRLLCEREVVWFLAGLEVAAFLPAFRAAFTTHEYHRLTDAALAEVFTAAELRRLQLKGWKRMDHVEFHAHDVDHVIVGPGGVLVIETKYTNVSWPIYDNRFDNTWANDAVDQARRNADHIKALPAQKLKASYDGQPIRMIGVMVDLASTARRSAGVLSSLPVASCAVTSKGRLPFSRATMSTSWPTNSERSSSTENPSTERDGLHPHNRRATRRHRSGAQNDSSLPAT